MAMIDAIEQEYTDKILVTTTLLKEALRRDYIKHDEISDYMSDRGLCLDRDGNIKTGENNQENREYHNLKDDR